MGNVDGKTLFFTMLKYNRLFTTAGYAFEHTPKLFDSASNAHWILGHWQSTFPKPSECKHFNRKIHSDIVTLSSPFADTRC
jgi:hypothetical protein